MQVEYYNRFERLIVRGIKEVVDFFLPAKAPKILASVHKLLLKSRYSKKCDGYLEIGGSIFMQKEKELTLKEFKNKNILKIFKNKPKFIIGANFGPILNEEYVAFYRDLFSRFTDICFRDKKSYDLFRELDNIRYTSDIVYSLQIPKVEKEKRSIGISIINIAQRKELSQYENNYVKTIIELATNAYFDHRKVYLFSFCKSEGDEDAINSIIANVSLDIRTNIEVVNYNGDINGFLETYCKVESMFTTRFHAMILSLVSGQNVYPFIYSDKMISALDDIQFNKKYAHIKDLRPEEAKTMLKVIDQNTHQLKTEGIMAEDQFSKLDSYLIDE